MFWTISIYCKRIVSVLLQTLHVHLHQSAATLDPHGGFNVVAWEKLNAGHD